MGDKPNLTVPSFPVRKVSFNFRANSQPYYVQGNSIMTHYLNGYCLIIPGGEKSFVRVIQRYRNKIKDPQLSIDAKNFCGQEIEHKNQHENFIKFLENSGYHIQGLAESINWYLEKFTALSPKIFQIARAAGAEHLTTIFAHAAFNNRLLDRADPTIRKFFVWHCLEEMEHKHVAFDVFDTVCPRFCNYLFRMMGYLYVIFGGQLLVFIAMVKLIRQDIKMGRISFIGVLKDLILTFKKRITKNYFKDIFKEMMMFFKPSFHPRQIDDQAIRNAYYLEIEELTIASP